MRLMNQPPLSFPDVPDFLIRFSLRVLGLSWIYFIEAVASARNEHWRKY